MHSGRIRAIIPLAALWFVLAAPARGALDPDPDSLGLYFDTAANSNCAALQPWTTGGFYLVLCNPTAAVEGVACSIELVGVTYGLTTFQPRPGATNEVASTTVVRISSWPFPLAPGPIMFGTWGLLLMEPGRLDCHLRPHPDPSLPRDLPVIRRDGQWLLCGTASGNVDLPVAALNGDCPVADQTTSFGAVKSLFR